MMDDDAPATHTDQSPKAPKQAATTVTAGTLIMGTYEIELLINSGGMGEVYRGRNIHNGEPVAIKIVLPSLAHDPKIVALFQKESTVLSRLSHEAIVRYHVFTNDPTIGRPCMVMEFVSGLPLSDRIEQGPMAVADVKIMLRRIASGLDKAHRAGVVHRDLSPDNVILEEGLVEHAKLIDFGIAKSTSFGSGTLLGGQFAGKFNWVSPEQLGAYGGIVDGRSDIYSLALITAAASRGEILPMGASIVDAVSKRASVPALDGVDPVLMPLLNWMLQPDPGQRVDTMAKVMATLDNPALIPRTAPAGPAVPDPNRTVIEPLPIIPPPIQVAPPPPATADPLASHVAEAGPVKETVAPPMIQASSASDEAMIITPQQSRGPATPRRTSTMETMEDASPFGAVTTPVLAVPLPKSKASGKGGLITVLILLAIMGGGGGVYFSGILDRKGSDSAEVVGDTSALAGNTVVPPVTAVPPQEETTPPAPALIDTVGLAAADAAANEVDVLLKSVMAARKNADAALIKAEKARSDAQAAGEDTEAIKGFVEAATKAAEAADGAVSLATAVLGDIETRSSIVKGFSDQEAAVATAIATTKAEIEAARRAAENTHQARVAIQAMSLAIDAARATTAESERIANAAAETTQSAVEAARSAQSAAEAALTEAEKALVDIGDTTDPAAAQSLVERAANATKRAETAHKAADEASKKIGESKAAAKGFPQAEAIVAKAAAASQAAVAAADVAATKTKEVATKVATSAKAVADALAAKVTEEKAKADALAAKVAEEKAVADALTAKADEEKAIADALAANPVAMQQAFFDAYTAHSCVHLAITASDAKGFGLLGYAADPKPLDQLAAEWKAATKVMPDINVNQISPAQCPVLDFLTTNTAAPTLGLSLAENTNVIKSGTPVEGKITGGDGRPFSLFLVNGAGGATNISRWVSTDASGNASFKLVPKLKANTGPSPQLLLVVIGDPELPATLEDLKPNVAVKPLVDYLYERLRASETPAATGLGYFRLEN